LDKSLQRHFDVCTVNRGESIERLSVRHVQCRQQRLPCRVGFKTSKDGSSEQMKPLPDLEARRDALLDGIWSDLSNIADGHGLRALGEGAACEHCAARGVCRKDFQ
jgi:hypothetical protein